MPIPTCGKVWRSSFTCTLLPSMQCLLRPQLTRLKMSVTNESSTSTRVFVSGLPINITNKQLREHFAQKFGVTDAHVFPDRRIAFVGLTDHESAKKASTYFNKSFIRMSKISVELAKPVDLKNDRRGQAAPVSKKRQDLGGAREVHYPQKRKRATGDDGESLRSTQQAPTTPGPGPAQERQPHEDSVFENRTQTEQATATGDETEAADAAEAVVADDSDWLRGKTSRVLDLVGPDEAPHQPSVTKPSMPPAPPTDAAGVTALVDASSDTQHPEAQEEVQSDDNLPKITNGRLFLRNLPFSASEESLTALFAPFGNIEEVSLSSQHRFLVHDVFLIGTAYAHANDLTRERLF